jgi:hypothetical protein
MDEKYKSENQRSARKESMDNLRCCIIISCLMSVMSEEADSPGMIPYRARPCMSISK